MNLLIYLTILIRYIFFFITYIVYGDVMKVGDFVTRKSHNNDILFKIIKLENNIVYLKGVNLRIIADAFVDDLVQNDSVNKEDFDFEKELLNDGNLQRSDFFYIPGKILHIDGDEEYLKRCLNYYKKKKILAFGIVSEEEKIPEIINQYYLEIKPDIIVITGHDSYNNQ